MIRIATVLLASLAASEPLLAGTYWVSPNGEASWSESKSDSPLAGKSACSLGEANQNARAGDTIYLRAGTYSDVDIYPQHSGTSDPERIVYSSYDGERVVFQEVRLGIHIYKRSYITVNGIEFLEVGRFFGIYGGHHNTISYCRFDQRSNDSTSWAGALIADDPNDNTEASEDSTHNWIHHCEFYRFVYKHRLPNRGTLLDIGTERTNDRKLGDDSTHNLIEDNVFAYGGHHTLGVFSQYNVIRNNYIHNETNPDNWGFPGYRGAITQGLSSGRNLFERNRFGFSDQAGLGLRSPLNILRRNLFYYNGQGGIQVVSNVFGIDRADQNHIYHNTFFHNGHRDKYRNYQGGMYFANWRGVSPKDNIVKNNIFYDSKYGSITYEGPIEEQTIANNWDVNDENPGFVDIAGIDPSESNKPDLRLLADSAARDKGGWLTTVTSDSGHSNTFRVADANYFMDGWGIIEGDRIQLEGSEATAMITSVDYASNTITIDAPLEIKTGQGVSLAYNGAAPDLGAFEIED